MTRNKTITIEEVWEWGNLAALFHAEGRSTGCDYPGDSLNPPESPYVEELSRWASDIAFGLDDGDWRELTPEALVAIMPDVNRELAEWNPRWNV